MPFAMALTTSQQYPKISARTSSAGWRNNPRRVVHALEICLATGKTYTSFRTHQKKQRPFNIVKIGLNRPREELYERINARVLKMIDKGLEQEARTVFPLRHLNSLNTVGYKELFAYFDGRIPKEEAIRQIQSNTRQYMRKQLTWFKKDSSIRWFSPDNIEDILKYIDKQQNHPHTVTHRDARSYRQRRGTALCSHAITERK